MSYSLGGRGEGDTPPPSGPPAAPQATPGESTAEDSAAESVAMAAAGIAQGDPENSPAVLLAVDHSMQAESAVLHYLKYIHRPEYQVIILHVMQLPGKSNTYDEVNPGAIQQLWMDSANNAKKLENKYWDMLKDKGVSKVRCRADGGLEPGQVICRVAAHENAIMVIIGSRGRYQATQGRTGKVCDHVVRHAPCPVVVYRKESA